MDLFEWRKLRYLIIVDYYSRFIEIAQLDLPMAEAEHDTLQKLECEVHTTFGMNIIPYLIIPVV